ncbi:hypothetical protein CHS0354_037825 [Potamilus streckersoni]|uniref:adenosine deaminase n=1 Tax=Potamilus streckersoni TaxID=2493646 RepID=A0AAE0SIQ4_9BIVA|nr:hypothetical protein CHS0354_037825 [Potamilus streckersoni]
MVSRCLCLFLLVGLVHGSSLTADFYEYEHSLKRNMLQEDERKFAGWNKDLNEDEEIVNNYLTYLKWQEFQNTRAAFIPSRPIQDYLNQIKASKVYEVLKKFPKGGSLHLHHNHVVSKSIILDIIINSSLYENLYVKTSEPNKWKLDILVNPPEGWTKLKDIQDDPKKFILTKLTFLNVMDDQARKYPTDSAIRWSLLEPLFDRTGSSLVNHVDIIKKHTEALLRAALDENIQYLETKSKAGKKVYILDSSATETHGKRFIDTDSGDKELQSISSVVENFIKTHPEFIGYKRVVNSFRRYSKERIMNDLHKAVNLSKNYPNLIAGYDLVAEEDLGYSLMFYQENFQTLLAAHDKLPYFFHAGETNWPDDLLTSMLPEDPVSTAANLYDAIILGAKRIGHGIALANHPYLMKVLKSKKIAIEANPVSNMLLGYVQDQRHHPAITYFRYGVPVVISADDPATFGYDLFTADWYEVFMGWGFDLADLRQLANNSLQYSAMSSSEKINAFEKWIKAWNKFIQEMKTEACGLHFNSDQPFISNIFPRESYFPGSTKVEVFGRNFERSICQTVLCKFGDYTSKALYVNNNQITCNSPIYFKSSYQAERQKASFPFSISFDNGTTFLSTNLTFTFMPCYSRIKSVHY